MSSSRVTTLIDLTSFKGIYNTSDDINDISYLKEASNVYVTKDGFLKSRNGIELLDNSKNYTQIFTFNNYIIGVFNENQNYFLFSLHRLSKELLVLDQLPHTFKPKLFFCNFNDRLIICDEYYFRILNSDLSFYTPPTIQDPFKKYMYGGKYPTIYQGRLFVSRGNILYFSDALSIHTRDIRFGTIFLPDRIVGLIGLQNTLYIGSDKQYALVGNDFENMQLKIVSENTMFENTGNIVNLNKLANYLRLPTITGNGAIWLSKDGIVLGLDDGNIIKLTNERYIPKGTFLGSVIIDKEDSYTYLVI